MAKKNSYIELMRFVFIIVLLLHHTGNYGLSENISNMPSGYIIVEFFYILMGAMTMAHIEKNRDSILKPMEYGMKYTIGKIKRLFPFAAFGTLTCYVWFIYNNYANIGGIKGCFWTLCNMLYEMFFVTFSGAFPGTVADFKNAPLWFLSAMLMVLPLIAYLAVKASDFFKNYLVWFAPFLIYGWLIHSWGNFAVWADYRGFLFGGVVRAFADITMGCAAYLVGCKIREIGKGKIFWTIAEIAGLVVTVYSCTVWPDTYHLVTVIIIMALCIGISMSGMSYTNIDNKVVNYFGGLAMPIYCLHWAVMTIVGDTMPQATTDSKIFTMIIVTIVMAVVLQFIVKTVSAKLKK